mmetsp:Transcript_38567/g.106231  ORF Transcript_38567/g.106231 Transcript_38567/m.106231 type:complete len:211 (+) Transcript_38567:1845-2477(+)
MTTSWRVLSRRTATTGTAFISARRKRPSRCRSRSRSNCTWAAQASLSTAIQIASRDHGAMPGVSTSMLARRIRSASPLPARRSGPAGCTLASPASTRRRTLYTRGGVTTPRRRSSTADWRWAEWRSASTRTLCSHCLTRSERGGLWLSVRRLFPAPFGFVSSMAAMSRSLSAEGMATLRRLLAISGQTPPRSMGPRWRAPWPPSTSPRSS